MWHIAWKVLQQRPLQNRTHTAICGNHVAGCVLLHSLTYVGGVETAGSEADSEEEALPDWGHEESEKPPLKLGKVSITHRAGPPSNNSWRC